MYPITTGILLAVGLSVFLFSMLYRLAVLFSVSGEREKRWDRLGARVRGVLTFALGQKRLIFRDGKSGLMHAFIFWGFLVVSLQTITIFGQGLVEGFTFPLMNGVIAHIYILTKNLFEVLVLIGVIVLIFRRIFIRPKRLTLSAEGVVILAGIGILMLSDFLMELEIWFQVNFFVHTIGIILFLNYLPYGKHFHIITAIPNVFLRKTKPYGEIRPINLESESQETYGVDKVTEFNWKEALDLYSCTECGRCSDQCPATATGKRLNPKEMTIALRDHLYKNAARLVRTKKGEAATSLTSLVPQTIDPQILWDCTTCRACEEACPIFIEYVDKIVDMRRHLVLMRGEFAPEAQVALKNIENNSNPWGIGFSSRGEWANDLNVRTLAEARDVEYLYFVGCAGSFDARAKKVSRAFVHCLKKARVSFGILGAEEKCTGDSARRIGNEYLFQTLAKENIATFNRYKVKKILTTCPHCYNTIKNEFPQFGGNYKVIHHSEFLRDLIADKRLVPQNPMRGESVTFHDSCYLGRYNEIYDAPRDILKAIPNAQIEEMRTSREIGRCCGAGGGRMWMEEKTGTRINHKRIEDVRTETKATLVASACPYCLTMLTDAVKDTKAEGLKTKDIAELVAESL